MAVYSWFLVGFHPIIQEPFGYQQKKWKAQKHKYLLLVRNCLNICYISFCVSESIQNFKRAEGKRAIFLVLCQCLNWRGLDRSHDLKCRKAYETKILPGNSTKENLHKPFPRRRHLVCTESNINEWCRKCIYGKWILFVWQCGYVKWHFLRGMADLKCLRMCHTLPSDRWV